MPLRASHLFQQAQQITINQSPEEFFTVAVGSTLQRGDPVYKNTVTNEVGLADAATLLTAFVFGIVADGSVRSPGEQVSIRVIGKVALAFAGFTPGGIVYLAPGGVTSSALTQTAPGDGNWLTVVGDADTATDLIINFLDPIELGVGITVDALVGIDQATRREKALKLAENLQIVADKVSGVMNRTLADDYTIQLDTTLLKSDLLIPDGVELTISDTGELLML